MLRLILHQIWNQRRQNLWIWLELAALSAFLWIVLDPLFTMVCTQRIPFGFERDKIYLIAPVCTARPLAGEDPDFVSRTDNLLTQLQSHPLVEAVCLNKVDEIPGGTSSSGGRYYPNQATAKKDEGKDWYKMDNYIHAQWFGIYYIEGLETWTDMLYVLGVRDAVSGEYLHVRPDALAQRLTYVSAGMARRLHGTVNAKDSTVFTNGDDDPALGPSEVEHGSLRKIDAVFADIKHFDYQTPYPAIFRLQRDWGLRIDRFGVMVRVKEGVDGDRFMKDIQQDVLRHCCVGPVKRFTVTPLKHEMDIASTLAGANNVVRLQAALGFFGLLCVFLRVSGLFWVRCGERRQDIGVMRSLGATRRMVNRQMLLEGTLLLTAAFLSAMLFVAWHVHANGYDVGLTEEAVHWNGADMSYWFNRPVPHVLVVTLLTYALMLLITLLATWVPVHRATRVLPGDALRDE